MDETTTFAFSIIELQALTPQIKTGAIILLFIAFDIANIRATFYKKLLILGCRGEKGIR